MPFACDSRSSEIPGRGKAAQPLVCRFGSGGEDTAKTITIVEFFSIFMNELLFIESYYFISIIVSFS